VFLVPHDRTQEGFETTVGINYFGPFLLTHLLLDKLQESSPARHVPKWPLMIGCLLPDPACSQVDSALSKMQEIAMWFSNSLTFLTCSRGTTFGNKELWSMKCLGLKSLLRLLFICVALEVQGGEYGIAV